MKIGGGSVPTVSKLGGSCPHCPQSSCALGVHSPMPCHMTTGVGSSAATETASRQSGTIHPADMVGSWTGLFGRSACEENVVARVTDWVRNFIRRRRVWRVGWPHVAGNPTAVQPRSQRIGLRSRGRLRSDTDEWHGTGHRTPLTMVGYG